jgi:hypothetical protein
MKQEHPLLKYKLYHGTSLSIWKRYKRQKQIDVRNDFSRWLSAKGIYLFVGNPHLAYRFALERVDSERAKARMDRNIKKNELAPVVLEVSLRKIPRNRILDLTTADGHQLLWDGHRTLAKIVLGPQFIKVVKSCMKADQTKRDKEYFRSLVQTLYRGGLSSDRKLFDTFFRYMGISRSDIDTAYEILSHIPRIRKADSSSQDDSYNYDCAVLTELVRKRKLSLVISTIQEGLTYNERWHRHIHETADIEGFSGLRFRDHIEFCVTDPQYIKWPPKPINVASKRFDDKFWSEYQRYEDPYSRLE